MSEDFDKEAEREKLREKYERDKQKREATEQMSELLLQGATMTNAHCSECGDPVFRYEGQEFCPTCEKPVDRGEAEDEGEAEDGGEADDEGEIQVTTPSDEARVAFGEDGQPQEETGAETQPPTEQPPGSRTAGEGFERESEPSAEQSETRPRREPARSETPREVPTAPAEGNTGEASVTAARESLVRTLTRFSQQAAATDDPARAREHLAAAREAAEALAALRQ